MELTHRYVFEIDTEMGPADAQEKATAKMEDSFPDKQELVSTVEKMTAS